MICILLYPHNFLADIKYVFAVKYLKEGQGVAVLGCKIGVWIGEEMKIKYSTNISLTSGRLVCLEKR